MCAHKNIIAQPTSLSASIYISEGSTFLPGSVISSHTFNYGAKCLLEILNNLNISTLVLYLKPPMAVNKLRLKLTFFLARSLKFTNLALHPFN